MAEQEEGLEVGTHRLLRASRVEVLLTVNWGVVDAAGIVSTITL